MYSEEKLQHVSPRQPAAASDFYVSVEDDNSNTNNTSSERNENRDNATMDALTKQELNFIDKTKPIFHEKFGFSDDATDEITRPTALATIALPLLFVVKGLTAPYYFGSWAQMIPQMFSLLIALLSDCLPLKGGLRRKPYIWIGFIGMMLANLLLVFFYQSPVGFLLIFVQETCRLTLWIVGDAMVVERTWLDGGNILIICQAMYYVGEFLKSLPDLVGFYSIYGRLLITVLLPCALLIPFLPHLKDARVRQTNTTQQQQQDNNAASGDTSSFTDRVKDVLSDIFMVLQTQNTLYILGFTLLYITVNTCVQVMNIFDGLMEWFMIDGWAYALLTVFFIALYSKFLMNKDYHLVFIISSVLIMIVVGLGYINWWLLRGGNVFIGALMTFSQLPLLLMYTALCPPGSEATMFYIMQIARIAVAKEMGVQLFFANTFNNYYWIAYILMLVPLIAVRLAPKSRQHQAELQQQNLAPYPMQLLALVGFVILFFVFMQWFWNYGYQRANSAAENGEEYDGSYYASDNFWQDWTRFQFVF